ncbi:glycosyltransferase [Mycobacterium sp. 2YAF39]|uniref:glycosyltransferase n=1 Tax=Mycobacterium sp. 2YAF39 TaxID=3233033 RepID=UPI003F996236
MPPSAQYGGAERVVGSFADELELAGFTVHTCGLKPRDADPVEPGHPINNIYWPFDGGHRSAAQRVLWHAIDTFSLASRRAVEKIVDELRPDVVITHNLRGWGYAPWVVAGKRGVPLIHVVHDYGLICNSSTLWHGGVCTDICTACRPRLKVAQRRWPGGQLVGVSRAVLSEHQRFGLQGVEDAVVIYPTEAAGDLRPTAQPISTVVPKVVGYLGRVSEPKGVEVLLAAIDGIDKTLLVAGEGERGYVERLMAQTDDNVQWLGWSDPQVLYDAIDVLVVPSVWLEPFGIIVVEAARAGVPVLIAERPGLIEAAHVAGARYATFEPDNVEALRQALNRPLSDYRVEPTTIEQPNIVELVTELTSRGKAG